MLTGSVIKHKGLKRLATRGDASKIDSRWLPRVKRVLYGLNAAAHPTELNVPGYDFHELKGNRAGTYAVKVSANYRITFDGMTKGHLTSTWRTIMADKNELLAFRPPHPGEYLREDILPALDMTVSELAAHLGVTRQTLSRLINERSDVSVDMAQRLGQAFGNGARYWLALQMQYDLWEAQRSSTIRVPRLNWKANAAA